MLSAMYDIGLRILRQWPAACVNLCGPGYSRKIGHFRKPETEGTVYTTLVVPGFSLDVLNPDAANSSTPVRCGAGSAGRFRADNQASHPRTRSRSAPRPVFRRA